VESDFGGSMYQADIILGVHSMCETGEFREKHIPLLEKWYKWGARIVEIVPFNWWNFPAMKVGHAAKDTGLMLSLGFGLPQWADPTSADGGSRQMAYDMSSRLIDYGEECGAIGLYGAIGQAWGCPRPPDSDSWKRGVEGARDVCEYALNIQDFSIGFETLNRFEASRLNTVNELLRFLAEVNCPNAVGHCDFFHMNIEEDSVPEALYRMAAERKLGYVHANDTHRGQPGTGHMTWAENFQIFKNLRVKNLPVVMESFNPNMPNVAGPTATWRPFAPTQEHLIEHGLKFLKDTCEKAGLTVAV